MSIKNETVNVVTQIKREQFTIPAPQLFNLLAVDILYRINIGRRIALFVIPNVTQSTVSDITISMTMSKTWLGK